MQDLRKANKKSKKPGFSGKNRWSDDPMQTKKPTYVPPPMPDLRYIFRATRGNGTTTPENHPFHPTQGYPLPPFWGRAGRVLHITLCAGLG